MFSSRRPTTSVTSNRIAYKMRTKTTTRRSSASSASTTKTTMTRSSAVGHSTTPTTTLKQFLCKITQTISSMFVVCRLLLTEWYLRAEQHLVGNAYFSKWPIWTTRGGAIGGGGGGGGAKRRKRKRTKESNDDDSGSSSGHPQHHHHHQQQPSPARQNWPNPLPLAGRMPFDANNDHRSSSSSSSSRSLCSGLEHESTIMFDDDDDRDRTSTPTTIIVGRPEDSTATGAVKSTPRPANLVDAQSRDPIMDQVDLQQNLEQQPLPQQPQQQQQRQQNNQDDDQDDDDLLLAARDRRFRITEKQFTYLKHKIEKLLVRLESEYETEVATTPDEECVICISAKATMQTYPCQHRVVCRKCFVKTIQMVVSQRMLPLRCVICRAKVLRLKQITSIEYANCFSSSFGTFVRSSSSSSVSNTNTTNGSSTNSSSTTNGNNSNNLFPPKTNNINNHSKTEKVLSQLEPEIYTIDVTKNGNESKNRSKPSMAMMIDNNNTSSTSFHQQYNQHGINPFKWLNQNTNHHHDRDHQQFQPKFNRTNANNSGSRLIRTNLNNIQPRSFGA